MHNSLTLKRQGYLLTNKYIHYICADKINAMIKTNLFLLLFVLLAGTSCNRQQHFISDDTFRAEVENDFRAKQAALPDGNLFSVFNQKMTSDEKEALTFLYSRVKLMEPSSRISFSPGAPFISVPVPTTFPYFGISSSFTLRLL